MATSSAQDSASAPSGRVTASRSPISLATGGAVGVAVAEIEAQQPADPVQVADDQRLVETVLGAQGRQRVGPRIGAQHHQRRIARQHLDDGEDDDRRQRQRDQGGGEAAGEEVDHAFQ